MKSKAREWRSVDSGERSFSHQARPAVIQAARARYIFARPWCEGRKVCDIGCGSGLGVSTLAPAAERLFGLDYSPETLLFAKSSSGKWSFTPLAGDALLLPFKASSLDTVIAFELIEHLSRPSVFLAEVTRVLRRSGTFVLSTPNRPVYSPRGTWLDYHVREYDLGEFRGLLDPFFSSVELFGQAHLSSDARLDMHPLNRVFYPLKRRIDPRGVVLNRFRAAYVFLRWGERPGDCTPERFPVVSEGIESLPILIGVCSSLNSPSRSLGTKN